jgi:hypothetical protein
MKTIKWLALAAMVVVAFWASAGPETVQCVLAMPADGGHILTSTVCTQADGGVVSCGRGFCNWPANSNVGLQCTADVYMNQDGYAPDAGDVFVDFTNAKDPYVVNLANGQQTIGVTLVTAATGQACRFAPSMRRKPW